MAQVAGKVQEVLKVLTLPSVPCLNFPISVFLFLLSLFLTLIDLILLSPFWKSSLLDAYFHLMNK